MIYRNNYFKKEARQAYIDNTVGFRRKIILALFMGLVSFAAYFVLQTLMETVLSDTVPEIMQPSFFSTLYIYNHAALLSMTVYFILYHDYLFFSEISRNAWYMLIHMGYRPIQMISGKLAALLYSVFMVFSIGFAFTVLLTVFLQYNFVFAYMPALYITGLADIVLLTSLSAMISLFVKMTENARLYVFASAIMVILLKATMGIYEILRNRVTMQNINNLFDISRSWYFPTAAAIMMTCIIGAILRAWQLAQYYNCSAHDEDTLPEGVMIVHIDSTTGRQRKSQKKTLTSRYRGLLKAIMTALLILIILFALAFNVLIILLSTATPGNEVAIRGTIPYVFKSDTMQPSIMVNDLVFFRKIDSQHAVETGQIILFKDNNIVYIQRIIQKCEDMLEVDIDHYPPAAMTGAMIKQIPRNAIYGVYSGKSRWLGALILFANTIIGRILFLLVPTVLLFYGKRIMALYNKAS